MYSTSLRHLFGIAVLAVFNLSSLSGQLVGELGILDLTANGGLNPATSEPWQAGDQYRLVFVTSTTRDATEKDITVYNAFAQTAADSSSLNLSGATWKVLGSTATISARVNTGTDSGIGEAILLIDGTTIVANDHADLWDGSLDAPINLDEELNTLSALRNVWTGSTTSGNSNGFFSFGDEDDGETRATSGNSQDSSSRWTFVFNNARTDLKSFYALSDPLTILDGPVSGEPAITAFTSLGDDLWEVTFEGSPDTEYEFRSSTSLVFAPGILVEGLTQESPNNPGTISGPDRSVLTTDSEGNATFQMNLSGDANFVRASLPSE